MYKDAITNPNLTARPLGRERSPFCLHREVGLAAIAAELQLELFTLAPEVAQAVEKGAAALFLSGYGPRPAARARAGFAEKPRARALGLSREEGWDVSERQNSSEAGRLSRMTSTMQAHHGPSLQAPRHRRPRRPRNHSRQ